MSTLLIVDVRLETLHFEIGGKSPSCLPAAYRSVYACVRFSSDDNASVRRRAKVRRDAIVPIVLHVQMIAPRYVCREISRRAHSGYGEAPTEFDRPGFFLNGRAAPSGAGEQSPQIEKPATTTTTAAAAAAAGAITKYLWLKNAQVGWEKTGSRLRRAAMVAVVPILGGAKFPGGSASSAARDGAKSAAAVRTCLRDARLLCMRPPCDCRSPS